MKLTNGFRRTQTGTGDNSGWKFSRRFFDRDRSDCGGERIRFLIKQIIAR